MVLLETVWLPRAMLATGNGGRGLLKFESGSQVTLMAVTGVSGSVLPTWGQRSLAWTSVCSPGDSPWCFPFPHRQGGALLGGVNALHTSFPANPLEQYQRQCELILEKLELPSLLSEELRRLER